MGNPNQVQIGRDGHRVDVFRDAKGQARCNSRRRGKEALCRRHPVKGSLRCKLHGGTTPRGPASPNYKHGGTSAWRQALGLPRLDPDDVSMLDVRHGVEIQEQAVAGIAHRLKENDSPGFRKRCRALMGELRTAISSKDPDAIGQAVRKLEGWIHRGNAEDSSLHELSMAAERLSRQVEGAHRARTNALNSVNLQDAQRFFARVVVIVREEVGVSHATAVLDRIDREVLGNSPAGNGAASGGRVIEAGGTVAD